MQFQIKKVAQLLINEELHPSTWQESLVLLCSSETYLKSILNVFT